MASWIRFAVKKLGSSLETRQIAPYELHQARLLGDPIARFDHAGEYGKVRTTEFKPVQRRAA